MFEEVTYTLTASELYAALCKTRRAGTVRLVVQTVLLALLSAAFCADFAWKRQGGSLFVGIVLAVLAVGQWLFPAIAFRREAKQLAAEARPVHLRIEEQSLGAGDVTKMLSDCELMMAGDSLLLWRVDKIQSVAIPRRAVSDEAWALLKTQVD